MRAVARAPTFVSPPRCASGVRMPKSMTESLAAVTGASRVVRERESLRAVIESIGRETDLRPLLTHVLRHACALVAADDGVIGLVDQARGVVVSEAAYHMPPEELGSENADRRGIGRASAESPCAGARAPLWRLALHHTASLSRACGARPPDLAGWQHHRVHGLGTRTTKARRRAARCGTRLLAPRPGRAGDVRPTCRDRDRERAPFRARTAAHRALGLDRAGGAVGERRFRARRAAAACRRRDPRRARLRERGDTADRSRGSRHG